MDAAERNRLLATLRATARDLPRLLGSFTPDLLRWRPAPGKWSALEILCHMRDMERDAYLGRYRRILAEERPLLPDIDGDVYAIENDYPSADARVVLEDWLRLRAEVLGLLFLLDEAAWWREGVHSTYGPNKLEDFLRRQAIGNDEAHLAQIRAITPRHDLFEKLRSGPERLEKATADLGDDVLRRRPAPGKWAIVEIACHLRDIERVNADRFAKTAFQEKPQLFVLDNDRTAEKRRYVEEDLATVIAEFRLLRDENLALLRALPQPVWNRTAIHPTRGEVSIADLAGILAGHDDRHLARIDELKRKELAA